MCILSAIVWLGLYLHGAMSNVALRVNDQALPVGDQPAGAFVAARFDVGDAPALTYGVDADGFAAAGSGWRVAAGDEWATSVGFDAAGGLVVAGGGGVAGVREFAWIEAVVLPEPSVAAWAIVPLLATRRRAVRQP